MAMMQSYQCENTYQAMLKNFYSSCSRIDYELWYLNLVSRSIQDRNRAATLRKKMNIIDHLAHKEILLNEIFSDYTFVSLVTSFNGFVNSFSDVNDTNFYLDKHMLNMIDSYISNMSEYLKKFIKQKKDILCSKESEEIPPADDVMVPYELVVGPEKKEKPDTNAATKKKIKRNGCVPKSSATRKSNIEFSSDMQQNVDNLNILYSKFKEYGMEYLSEEENYFISKQCETDSFNIINLCVLIKMNNKNALDFYNKNKSIMKIFFEKFSSLEQVANYLEKYKNIEIVTPSTKKNINICYETVKQLLRDMLQILKYMNLDIIGNPVN